MRSNVISLCAVVFFAFAAVQAAEPDLQVVGFLVNPAIDADDAAEPAAAFCLRAGELLEASEGMALLEGDEIRTGADAVLGVVFLDSSAITLGPRSTLVLNEYAYPRKRQPTRVALTAGEAFFAINPRPAGAHFFVATPTGTVEVKGTKFKIFTSWDAGQYVTSVACTDGSVAVQTSKPGQIELSVGEQVLIRMQSDQVLPGLPPEGTLTFQKRNMTAQEIKAAQANAISTVEVNVGKNDVVKIKTVIRNMDGSVTTTTVTEVNGFRASLKSQTKGADKKVITKIQESGEKKTIVESDGKSKITVKLNGSKGTLTAKLSAPKKGAADGLPLKNVVFKGDLTIMPDGSLAGQGVSKNGDKVTLETTFLPDGTLVKTESYDLVENGQTTTVTFVTQKFKDGSSAEITAVFEPGATTGTQTIKTIALDGSVTLKSIEITASKAPGGGYVPVDGAVEIVLGALPPSNNPPPPQIQTETTDLSQPEKPASR